MSLLELRHVSKAYNEKVLALDDVNLKVEKGEWLAVMGPSGSGKSTLMNIIGCMDSATSGEVILDGEVLTDATPEELTRYRRDKIGIVFHGRGVSRGQRGGEGGQRRGQWPRGGEARPRRAAGRRFYGDRGNHQADGL